MADGPRTPQFKINHLQINKVGHCKPSVGGGGIAGCSRSAIRPGGQSRSEMELEVVEGGGGGVPQEGGVH